jgi:DNA-binding transcriptional MerR regulator
VFYTVRVGQDVAIRVFGLPKVKRLTGLSARQLQYWDERRFLPPSVSAGAGRGRPRLYDFRDLVSLRVAADLRRQGVSLQLIRKVHAHLQSLDYRHPLAELTFWAFEGQLYFSEAETVRAGRRPEQVVASFVVPVPRIVESLQHEIAQLDERPLGEIERRRGTLGSKRVIKGTRIPTASIRRLAEDGLSEAEILQMYPDLGREDVRAALAEERPPRARSGTG